MRPEGPIVIALDGSAHSAQTLAWGMHEAELRGAEVLLARAVRGARQFVLSDWYPYLGDAPADPEAKEYLATVLTGTQGRHPGLRVGTQILEGPPVPAIRELTHDAQLLVLGARGHAGVRRVGSVAAHLAAQAACPVAIVRTSTGDRPDAGAVVVGVDGSPESIAAARVGAQEAVLRASPLVLLHARLLGFNPYASPPALPPGATADTDDPTSRAARRVAEMLRADQPALDIRVELIDDEPVHGLIRFSEHAALLVMGSRGLGAFRGMLLGSVSNEVVREATCTILLVRAQTPAERAQDTHEGKVV